MSNYKLEVDRMKMEIECKEEDLRKTEEYLKNNPSDRFYFHMVEKKKASLRLEKLSLEIFILKNKEVTIENQKAIVELTAKQAGQNYFYKDDLKKEEEILRKLEESQKAIYKNNQRLFF